MILQDKREIKSITLSAVVIRADGTIEDLGVISKYEQSIFRKFINFWGHKWQLCK